MRNLNLIAIASAVLVLATAQPLAHGQEDDEPPRRETKRAETLSKAVYEDLTEAQEAIDAEPQDLATATRIVNNLLSDDITDFERGNVLNFKGFLEYTRGNNVAAIRAYEEMIQIESLEPGNVQGTIYTIAQLYAQEENYPKTIEYLNRWFETATNPAPDAYILLAQSYAQLEQYRQMIPPIDSAIAEARERDQSPKEEWFNLKYYACYQMENFNCVRDTLKILIAGWPKKTYWLQLAGIFNELEEERSMLAIYEAAYTDGLLTTESELVTMAQLYLQGEVPFAAARVLESGMESGTISENAKNYRLLSQAWTLARDDEKAIPALREAAKLSDDGDVGAGLAIAFLNTERYGECIDAGEDAIQKGGLQRPDDGQVTIGMCQYNLDRLTAARRTFNRVASTGSDRNKRLARQWMSVIDGDLTILEDLRQLRRSVEEAKKRNSVPASEEAAP